MSLPKNTLNEKQRTVASNLKVVRVKPTVFLVIFIITF